MKLLIQKEESKNKYSNETIGEKKKDKKKRKN